MAATPLALLDHAPDLATFHAEALAGLQSFEKTLPCKYFYDRRGSQLFDLICELPEYYPTRTEAAIMRDHVGEMAALFGPDTLLIEYGSDSSTKTRILLDHLPHLAGYVPMDISREHLYQTADGLCAAYPHLDILPLCADYTAEFDLPTALRPVCSRVVYFPGSTIGNFHREQAAQFLEQIAETCGPGGGLLIGVDLRKAPQILEPAYNDRQGITAAFNLNLLRRMNEELGADFDLDQFAHYAFYNDFVGRIEMHLMSLRPQTVHLGNTAIAFEEEETILTECSYKYSLPEFEKIAASAGLVVRKVWT
ncbi:MAG: L-histidine N(alpha)-methyltransferase, partial [Armatimonadota bacterium]|nr:L-histidine N(alpha)-methyltransferase [Armatimonadota bacterium]